ncbi:MAG: AmmeMemoRadiSam system protein B [Deltaproteobacteria bacterium]|nr:AmmeMemoRadiSam system protein B [Deltaproteobacteria bacterium]
MVEENIRPRLRYVEVFPLPDEQGRSLFGMRDPQQITSHILCISLDVAYVFQFLDGTRTMEEIRSEFQRRFNRDFPADLLSQVIRRLDESYFLDNDAFQLYLTELVESFRQAEVREAFHAGISYSKDAMDLHNSLTAFFSGPNGPGIPNGAVSERQIPAIIAPHIDLRIGGHTYAWAYKQLAEAQKPDVVIVLGTGHSGLRNLFSLTRKRFATPLGELQIDPEFVNRLTSLYQHDLFSDELAHRTEHTIEFQVLFLQLLFGSGVSLVPILCSFAYSMVKEGHTAEIIRRFTEALQMAIRQDGRRICLVASADLAHVGPRYGDREGFAGERLERVKEGDREMLAYVEKVDADGFLDYIAREEDQRRICGLSPIYTMLKVLDARRGKVLSHSHGDMDNMGSVCSYASVILEA